MVEHRMQFGIPGYLDRLAKESVKVSDRPLVLKEERGIGYDSETRMGTPEQPVNEIVYTPKYRKYRNHFLASGILKILRFYSEPPENRFLAGSYRDEGLPERELQDLVLKKPPSPGFELVKISMFLRAGIVKQLISMPVDLRVERELYQDLEIHREAQREYLFRQVKDLEETMDLEIERLTPETLYKANIAMNIALIEVAANISGQGVPSCFKASKYRRLGEALLSHHQSIPESGHPGDRRLTDLWAQELGLDGWYQWVNVMDLAHYRNE